MPGAAMPFVLPDLPYALDALEPYVSATTLATHHGKHHRAYVEKANAFAGPGAGSPEQVILGSAGDPARQALFNNAAQAWNHAFYWRSLRPRGAPVLTGWARWVEPLKAAALAHFGSGWVWLVRDGSEIKVVTTSNADTPLVHGQVPLLVIDVWEHAYYLDYRERRAAYVEAVVPHLLDWRFADENLRKAEK